MTTSAPPQAGGDLMDAARQRLSAVVAQKIDDLAQSLHGKDLAALTGGRYRSATAANVGPAWSSSGPAPAQDGPGRAFLTPKVASDLRARCQELRRNNTVARAMARALATHVQGDGYPIEVKSDDPAYNAEARRILADLVASRGLAHLGASAVWAGCFEGDMLLLRVKGGLLQPVEAGRLVTPGASGPRGFPADSTTITTTERGTMILDGVEVDAVGTPVAFHVGRWKDEAEAVKAMEEKRQTRTQPSGAWAGVHDVTRVDAADCLYLRWPVGHDFSRVRGEPAMQASLGRLHLIDALCENAAVASALAASIGLIFTTPNPQQVRQGLIDELQALNGAAAAATTQPQNVTFGPGFTYTCHPGEDVKPFSPEWPAVPIREFVMTQLQLVAADLGLPLMLAVNDMASLTASNAKMTLQMAYRGFDVLQDWLIQTLWMPVLKWWLALEIRARRLPLVQGWDRLVVHPRYAPIIDMKAEFEALNFGVRNNLITHQQAVAQVSGDDFETVIAARAAERAAESAAGVSPMAAPGAKPMDG